MKKDVVLFGFVALVFIAVLSFAVYDFVQRETLSDEINTDDIVFVPPPEASTTPEYFEGYTPPTEHPPTDEKLDGISTSTPNTLSVRDQLAQIMVEIEAAAHLSATSPDQCRLLPLGHSPCGGPAFYFVYATTNSNDSKLQELSVAHQELAEQLNQTEEVMGICAITPEPQIVIENGNCVALIE